MEPIESLNEQRLSVVGTRLRLASAFVIAQAALSLVLVGAVTLLPSGLGRSKAKAKFSAILSKSAEIGFLDEWLEEVKSKRPLSKLEIMQREMETAIAKELYERAAE